MRLEKQSATLVPKCNWNLENPEADSVLQTPTPKPKPQGSYNDEPFEILNSAKAYRCIGFRVWIYRVGGYNFYFNPQEPTFLTDLYKEITIRRGPGRI